MPSSTGSKPLGGDERTRTADPLLAKQVLYQLSYVPLLTCKFTNSPMDAASARRWYSAYVEGKRSGRSSWSLSVVSIVFDRYFLWTSGLNPPGRYVIHEQGP